MNAFRFSLENVLSWRRTQLDLEEARFQRQAAELAALDRTRAALEASAVAAEIEVRDRNTVSGDALAALAAFRGHIREKKKELAARRRECEKVLERQKKTMLEARRRCRLLERLKERRVAEWRTEFDRETEAMASESYLAQWTRRL